MRYLLDGYNLLFFLIDSKNSFAAQRQKIIRFLQILFSRHKMNGILIFDGRVRYEEESGRSYPSPLEVVYTSEGQSADEYIIERIENLKTPAKITVVTNDRALMTNAKSLKAQTVNISKFINWLTVRKKSKEFKPSTVETKYNTERLLKIFEKRLEENN